MTRMDDLRDQATRAERLACCVTDALTIERLAGFAADCRREMRAIAEKSLSTACNSWTKTPASRETSGVADRRH
jgi:hypothetical protein